MRTVVTIAVYILHPFTNTSVFSSHHIVLGGSKDVLYRLHWLLSFNQEAVVRAEMMGMKVYAKERG